MTGQLVPVFYGDSEVRCDRHGFFSLTDMWFAAGKPEGKLDPRQWARKPREIVSGASGKTSENGGPGYEFIDFIAKNLNVAAGHIYKTTRGKFGGTWAHWQIALAYAKYLSPEFHAWANQAIKDRLEEDANPELGVTRSRERAIDTWKRRGKSDAFIKARLAGIDARNVFTDALKTHGVTGNGYGICTNNIYDPILGGTAAAVKANRGLLAKANLREHLSPVELAGSMFAEILATDKIERENRQGLNPCASACLTSAMQIKETISRHEQAIAPPAQQAPAPVPPSYAAKRLEAMRDKRKAA